MRLTQSWGQRGRRSRLTRGRQEIGHPETETDLKHFLLRSKNHHKMKPKKDGRVHAAETTMLVWEDM